MKKLLKLVGFAAAAAVGLLVWRKVEEDRLENDLWAEAERISDQEDSGA